MERHIYLSGFLFIFTVVCYLYILYIFPVFTGVSLFLYVNVHRDERCLVSRCVMRLPQDKATSQYIDVKFQAKSLPVVRRQRLINIFSYKMSVQIRFKPCMN